MQDAVERETGLLPKLSTTGGTSDARFIKDYCPVLEFGPTNATIHQTDERIAIEELRATQAIYSRIIADYFWECSRRGEDKGLPAAQPVRRPRGRRLKRRFRSAGVHLPSPTSFSEPTMERTWLCRKERASARISISSP